MKTEEIWVGPEEARNPAGPPPPPMAGEDMALEAAVVVAVGAERVAEVISETAARAAGAEDETARLAALAYRPKYCVTRVRRE